MEWWEPVSRIALSIVVGGMIGLQREFKNNPAGFRTHILVSLGACIAMLTNEYLFFKFQDTLSIDIGRMGSYVISGIGFLGAGSILKDNERIRGLTTAAGLWVVACLGISVGAGYYLVAGVGAIIVFIVLLLLKKIELVISGGKRDIEINVTTMNFPEQINKVFQIIKRTGATICDIQMLDFQDQWVNVIINVSNNEMKIDSFHQLLSKNEHIRINSINYM